MVWVGVELWRVTLPADPGPVGVESLLWALEQWPSEQIEATSHGHAFREGDDAFAPIAVDLLDSAGWVNVGFSARQAQSAVRYRNAVGGFTSVDVLRKMRVLPKGWLSQYASRLVFPPPSVASSEMLEVKDDMRHPARRRNPEEEMPRRVEGTKSPVNLNRADSITLLAIHGVGPWVAGRILKARRDWGGFSHVNQLELALGWDSMAHALSGRFVCFPEQVQKRCIGDLDAVGWSLLPGVGEKRGRVILRYVANHGARLASLRGCMALDSAGWANILPHLEECVPPDAAH